MRKFNPTQEMIDSAKSVFMAMALVDTIKPVVKGYEEEILNRHQYHIGKEWIDKGMRDEIIINPDQTYLLEDPDFQVYLKEAFEARDKAGLKVDNPEFCPLLVAEHLLVDAEHLLIESMKPITQLETGRVYGDNRKKLIDLSLKLLAPFVGNARGILNA